VHNGAADYKWRSWQRVFSADGLIVNVQKQGPNLCARQTNEHNVMQTLTKYFLLKRAGLVAVLIAQFNI